jgi:disulfide bond formation protein DsbB
MLSRVESEHREITGRQIVAWAGAAVAIASALALAGAWAFELAGYTPCPLCLEQRIAYYVAVPLGFIASLAASRLPRLSAVLAAALLAAFVYNAGLGVYHAGAEWKFWPGPDTCGVTGELAPSTGGSLSARLKANKPVRCDEAALRIAGISLAGYSAVFSAAFAGLLGFALVRSRRT